jgi:hypothetical protein
LQRLLPFACTHRQGKCVLLLVLVLVLLLLLQPQ